MISLHRSYSHYMVDEPLAWKPVRDGGRLTATVVCAQGHSGLIDEHTIADDGTVMPSVVCTGPDGKGGCAWHEFVRLEGWAT